VTSSAYTIALSLSSNRKNPIIEINNIPMKALIALTLLLAAVNCHTIDCQYASLPQAVPDNSLTRERPIDDVPRARPETPAEPVIPEIPSIASQAQTVRSWANSGESHEILQYLDVNGCSHQLHRWIDNTGCKHAIDSWIDAGNNAHQVEIWEDGDGCHHEVHQATAVSGQLESIHYRIDQHGVVTVVDKTSSVPHTHA